MSGHKMLLVDFSGRKKGFITFLNLSLMSTFKLYLNLENLTNSFKKGEIKSWHLFTQLDGSADRKSSSVEHRT